MMKKEEKKYCLNCKKELFGRADKKFCDEYCRNGHHNKLKSDYNNLMRNVNNALRKNRIILDDILRDKETAKVKKDRLVADGFHFKYQTHSYTTQKGDVYNFCYDCGYLTLDNDWFLVVKKRENES